MKRMREYKLNFYILYKMKNNKNKQFSALTFRIKKKNDFDFSVTQAFQFS